MAQLCLLCKCEAAKKTRRRLSESLLPALRAVHRVAWPDRGETADDPSWSESFLCRPCFRKCERLLRLKQDLASLEGELAAEECEDQSLK